MVPKPVITSLVSHRSGFFCCEVFIGYLVVASDLSIGTESPVCICKLKAQATGYLQNITDYFHCFVILNGNGSG